jgi:hypothetical protein
MYLDDLSIDPVISFSAVPRQRHFDGRTITATVFSLAPFFLLCFRIVAGAV